MELQLALEKPDIFHEGLFEKTTEHGAIFTVALKSVFDDPGYKVDEIPSYNRETQFVFKRLLSTLDIPTERFEYIGKAKFNIGAPDLRVRSDKTEQDYTIRFPMWVKDNEDVTIKPISFATLGRYSEHRFIGAAYGYPLCCVTAYVQRLKMFRSNNVEGLHQDHLGRMSRRQTFVKILPDGFEPCSRCEHVSKRHLAELIRENGLMNDTNLNNDGIWMSTLYLYITGQLKVWSYPHEPEIIV